MSMDTLHLHDGSKDYGKAVGRPGIGGGGEHCQGFLLKDFFVSLCISQVWQTHLCEILRHVWSYTRVELTHSDICQVSTNSADTNCKTFSHCYFCGSVRIDLHLHYFSTAANFRYHCFCLRRCWSPVCACFLRVYIERYSWEDDSFLTPKILN